MHLTQHLEIDNSVGYAVKDEHWRNPGAKLYRKLMNKVEWKDLLEEAYLIVDTEKIKNEESGITSYRECELRYPHHVIRNEKLVLSVPALKAAYAQVKKCGICHGELQQHLERHVRELEELSGLNMIVTSNLDDVYDYICEVSEAEDELGDELPATQEAALQELFLRRQNNTACLIEANRRIRYTSDEVETLRSNLKEWGEVIDHDIHAIINGRYDAAMMDKYRKLGAFADESPVEPTDATASEGNIQNYYRVGFDVETGKQVAIQFAGDAGQTLHADPSRLRYADLPEAGKWIEQYGDIDYRTDAFPVKAIFGRDGKALEQVKFIGLLSLPVMESIEGFLDAYSKRTDSFAQLFETEDFQTYLVEHLKKVSCFSEEHEAYSVDNICGYGTYKSSVLLWGRDLLLSYKLTPIFCGYNDPFEGEPAIKKVWLRDALEKLKCMTAQEELVLMKHLATNDEEWWRAMGMLLEQRFIFAALPGNPEIENEGMYMANPPLEKYYFETMMRVNGTVINETYPLQ